MTLRGLLGAALLSSCAHEQQAERPPAREAVVVVPTSPTQCERLRDEGKFRVQLRTVEAEKVLQTLADVTCFTFVMEKGLSATVTLQPSDDEPVAEWGWSEFFHAVRTELEKQGVLLREEGSRRYRVTAVR